MSDNIPFLVRFAREAAEQQKDKEPPRHFEANRANQRLETLHTRVTNETTDDN